MTLVDGKTLELIFCPYQLERAVKSLIEEELFISAIVTALLRSISLELVL